MRTGPGQGGAREAPQRNCKKVVWLESREQVSHFPLSNKEILGGRLKLGKHCLPHRLSIHAFIYLC